MIYEVEDGYVISSGGTWLPGKYESKKAARLAFRLTDKQLNDLAAPCEVITHSQVLGALRVSSNTIKDGE